MSEGLLTEEEVKSYLEVDSGEVSRLKRRGKLTAYKVGGAFVRYRKDQVVALRTGQKFQMPDQFDRNVWDHVRDFFSFYSLYIVLFVAVVFLVTYFVRP